MKRLLLYALLFSLIACEKKPTEEVLDIAYQIARAYSLDGVKNDSVIFSYSINKELLQVERFTAGIPTPFVSKVINTSEKIESWDGIYHKEEGGQIYKRTNTPIDVIYIFQNRLIVQEISVVDNLVIREEFFTYENSNLIGDSIVHYNQSDGKKYLTQYQYTYTDSLMPHFVLDASGLFEMPLKSKNLIRFSESKENGILNKYSYQISENELIQNVLFYDTFHQTEHETWTVKYTYIEKPTGKN